MQTDLFPWPTEMIEANGLEFETAVAGTGEKLALLLHGFPETHFSWREQIPLLVEQGYTVWAPNLRGYGRSSRPKGIANYKMQHLLDDIAGLWDAAEARGHKPSFLGAHDWGGFIAWMFVLNKVRPVERFMVVNLPHPVLFRKNFHKDNQAKKSRYIAFFQIPWLPEWLLTRNHAARIGKVFERTCRDRSRFPKDVIDVYRDNAAIPGAMTAMLNYYRANLGPGPRSMPRELLKSATTDVPTLVIWGEDDVALSVRLLDGTEELVSNLTMCRLPGVSHWAQQEAPEQANEAILSWLQDG